MTELERALEQLDVVWPETPTFDLRRPARRRLLLAAAALVAAVATALAVPSSRGAILRFLHLRGVSIERVGTLPAAQQQSLSATLGAPLTPRRAAMLLGRPFRFPDGVAAPLYRSGRGVSALFRAPEPVLLTELRTNIEGDLVFKKIMGAATGGSYLTLDAAPAVWVAGAPHVFQLGPLPPRLAGNVLLWVRGSLVYRLEGAALTLADARRLAEQILHRAGR
jgi:hypothetical protein